MKPEISLEHFWDRPLSELLHLLETTPAGLTSGEANRRLRLYGPNSFARESRFTALFSFLHLFANPLVIILVLASTISIVLGDPVGGLIIISIVLFSVLLNFFMEFQARHAVEKIQKQVATTVAVIRDGQEQGRGKALSVRAFAIIMVLVLCLIRPKEAAAYAVLAHEAIIDSVWNTNIRPLLLKRFPDATTEGLKEAHGYAYGGAIIQDMGYYPHGSFFFSDLTHYVRSGDFILALLRDSKDLDGYAFALGALAHYASDNEGHPIGTNRAVPLLYPKLQKKYGDSVTYEEDKLAHVKTEFGFDVLEVAHGRYAPDSYHDFIGFGVSVPLLEQAFQETYGLGLKTVLTNEDEVLGSYRHAVSQLLPKATRIAWSLKKDEILKDQPGMTRKKFLYNLSRASYQKNWGKTYKPPTFWERFFAFLTRILPKVGPLRVLQLKTPTPAAEKLFQASFNTTLDRYRQLLTQVGNGQMDLPNENFDTGAITGPGIYRLNDETHAKLLDALAKESFSGASLAVRAELLEFYGHPDAPYATKRKPKDWAKVQAELEQLKKAAPPVVPTAADGLVRPGLSSE